MANCFFVMRIEVDAKSNFREFLKNARGIRCVIELTRKAKAKTNAKEREGERKGTQTRNCGFPLLRTLSETCKWLRRNDFLCVPFFTNERFISKLT